MKKVQKMNRIHGHEVMRMMLETGKNYNRENLIEDIVSTFGTDTRFFTCSNDNLTPGELIDFLASRGKFFGENNSFNTAQDQICDHE